MAKEKKLDIFNLFYSGAAVIILIGVIAKLLEWPLQDFLITFGLAIEAVVFGVTAFKFVEVKKDTQVATEATLSKVADGLGSIASNASGLMGAGVVGDAYINIQTGVESGVVAANADQIGNKDNNVSIEINNAPNNSSAHTLWQLEQMDILSLAKDLFFQPKWDGLTSEEYRQISQLFKRVFEKKLPNKEALPFLVQFPVKLPVPELSKLTIDQPHAIDLEEIELLCKSFALLNFNNFFDNFILESSGEGFIIRPKKAGDVQIFGGEDELVIAHATNYYGKELIVSPNIECLQGSIKLKGQALLAYFIQKLDLKKESELTSVIGLLQPQSDEIKMKFWTKFKKIKYNQLTSEGYSYLRLLIQSVIGFSNATVGAQLVNKLVEIQVDEQKTIILDDVINYSAETIYFGAKNEYSVSLSELFVNGELDNLACIHSIIEKLVTENIASKSKLLQAFSLSEQDTKREVFDKLNYHLNKTNTSPSGSQLAFILLYKQYS